MAFDLDLDLRFEKEKKNKKKNRPRRQGRRLGLRCSIENDGVTDSRTHGKRFPFRLRRFDLNLHRNQQIEPSMIRFEEVRKENRATFGLRFYFWSRRKCCCLLIVDWEGISISWAGLGWRLEASFNFSAISQLGSLGWALMKSKAQKNKNLGRVVARPSQLINPPLIADVKKWYSYPPKSNIGYGLNISGSDMNTNQICKNGYD